MQPIDGIAKMRRVIELRHLAEEEYANELRSANPTITDSEIQAAINNWYADMDEHWPEEFFRPASQERINRILGKS